MFLCSDDSGWVRLYPREIASKRERKEHSARRLFCNPTPPLRRNWPGKGVFPWEDQRARLHSAVTIYPGTSARWRIVAWKLFPIFKPKRWHQNQASIYLVVFSSWWIKSWHANENVICQNDNNLKYCSQKGGPINVKRFFGIRFNL